MKTYILVCSVIVGLGLALSSGAVEKKETMGQKGSEMDKQIDAQARGTAAQSQEQVHRLDRSVSSFSGTMVAALVNPSEQARKQAAVVDVKLNGVKLVDPMASKGKPKAGEGHLNYRVDDEPPIRSTATQMRFTDLKPGRHEIRVTLANNNDVPIQEQAIEVHIPERKAK